jgi:hypothetical protein
VALLFALLQTMAQPAGTPPLLAIPANAAPQAAQAIRIENFNQSRDWERTLIQQMTRAYLMFSCFLITTFCLYSRLSRQPGDSIQCSKAGSFCISQYQAGDTN